MNERNTIDNITYIWIGVLIFGFLVFIFSGCNYQQDNAVNQPAQNSERRILGGELDYETNTITDSTTGKVYSLSDMETNEETMEGYYPGDEFVKNKPEKVILKIMLKPSTELPESCRDFKAIKVENGKFMILDFETNKWDELKHCPGNNSVIEVFYADNPTFIKRFKFSDMKWSIKE